MCVDAAQVTALDKCVPLAQTNLVGIAFDFEPVGTPKELSICLRPTSHFTVTATDLNPWQLAVYVQYVEIYSAGS